jgi:hypothetical protein
MKTIYGLLMLLAFSRVAFAQVSFTPGQLLMYNPSQEAHEQYNETFGLPGLSFNVGSAHRFSLLMEASKCTKDVWFYIDFPNPGVANTSFYRPQKSLTKLEQMRAEISFLVLVLSGKAMQAGDKSLSKKFVRRLKKVCKIQTESDAQKLFKELKPLTQNLNFDDDVLPQSDDRSSGKDESSPASSSEQSSGAAAQGL